VTRQANQDARSAPGWKDRPKTIRINRTTDTRIFRNPSG
jgi:hypothetical protein